jgi:hypothetical protein
MLAYSPAVGLGSVMALAASFTPLVAMYSTSFLAASYRMHVLVAHGAPWPLSAYTGN